MARYDVAGNCERLARQREAVPLRLVAAHAHGRALELRLSRDRVDGRRDQRADARVAREHAAPVHRHERLPRRHGVRDLETHDDARRGRRDLDEIAEREPETRGIERMQLHERLGVVAREARRLAGARHRVPLVADSARVQHERIVAARLLRRRARRRRHELRLAARREEAAVGEQPRRRGAHPPGAATGTARSASYSASLEIRDAADIEVARAVVLERREPRVLAEDRGRRVVVERRAEAHAPRDLRDDPPIGLRLAGRPAGSCRCREMRRSEFVTVPDFSPHAAAGSSTCAQRVVSVSRTQSETTTSSQRSSARRTRSASGMLTTGFVDMIQMALTSPRSTASNMSTALRPGFAATRGALQKRATRATFSGGEVHVRRELIREPADLAPAHRVRLARQRERPHAGLADAARREMHVDDRVDLVGAARRLIDALRERRDRHRRAREPAVELEHVVLGEPARRGHGGDRRRALLRDAQRGAEAFRVRVEELEIERIFFAKIVQ